MRTVSMVVLALAACEPVPPASLEDVAFPDGFSLQTTREVHLAVSLAPRLREEAPWVVIALPDGRLLSEGTVDADVLYDLRLPPGEDTLRITATVAGELADAVDLVLEPGPGASVHLRDAR